ncbi:MAG TPA: ester cyclase [Thermoanaerobaculia bacterium]|nr:ester cyclase [Thermoanaerobaculia bacterium]
MSTSATSHQLICHFMVEKVFNEGELDLLDLLIAPDAINHELEIFGPSAVRGPEAVRQFLRVFRSAFPDLRVTVIDQMGDGERVVTRWKMEGTQKNRLMGIEASHRFISVEGIRIDRIVGGQIAETWNRWDALGMLRQLGAMPQLERRPAVAAPAAAYSATSSVSAAA